MVGGLQTGDPARVGPYRLLGRLGAGGMGQVFLARSAGGRLVAVKVIRPELASDSGFRARFAREITVARQVSGLFTAVVVDADVTGDVPWLATGYVAGPSLDDAVKNQGPLPVDSVLTLAAGLAEGLQAIHATGLVHRDLKPSNVLLAEDGPRVIDFGISRAAEASVLTQTGTVMGSPGFMSPEQAEGRQVGAASDVFSLGAVLAFAATGEGPFGAGFTPALMYRVVHHQPDTSRLPSELRSLVHRCLAKDPAERPAPAALLAELGAGQLDAEWLPEQLTQAFGRYAPPDLTGSGTPWPGARSTPPLAAGGTPSPTLRSTPAPAADATPPPTVRSTPSPAVGGAPSPAADGTPPPTVRSTPSPAVGGAPSPAADGTPPPTVRSTPQSAVGDTPPSEPGDTSPLAGADGSPRHVATEAAAFAGRPGPGPAGTGPAGTGTGGPGPGGTAQGTRGPGRTGPDGHRRRRPGLVWILLTAALVVGGIAAIIVPKVINATPASQSQPTTGTKSTPGSSRPLQTEGSGSRSAGASSVPQPSPSTVAGSTSPVTGSSSSAQTSTPTTSATPTSHATTPSSPTSTPTVSSPTPTTPAPTPPTPTPPTSSPPTPAPTGSA